MPENDRDLPAHQVEHDAGPGQGRQVRKPLGERRFVSRSAGGLPREQSLDLGQVGQQRGVAGNREGGEEQLPVHVRHDQGVLVVRERRFHRGEGQVRVHREHAAAAQTLATLGVDHAASP